MIRIHWTPKPTLSGPRTPLVHSRPCAARCGHRREQAGLSAAPTARRARTRPLGPRRAEWRLEDQGLDRSYKPRMPRPCTQRSAADAGPPRPRLGILGAAQGSTREDPLCLGRIENTRNTVRIIHRSEATPASSLSAAQSLALPTGRSRWPQLTIVPCACAQDSMRSRWIVGEMKLSPCVWRPSTHGCRRRV